MAENTESPRPQPTSKTARTGKQQDSQADRPTEPISKDARQWAMFCHLAGLAGYVIWAVGNIVAPLIFWQLKKDEHPFIDENGKEAVNFQISMSIYTLVSAALIPVFCIGIPLLIAVGIVDLVFLLIAAIKANNGQHYRYPLTIRFIK